MDPKNLWAFKLLSPSAPHPLFLLSVLFFSFLFNVCLNVSIAHKCLYPTMYRIRERILGKSLSDLLVYSTNLMSFPAQKGLEYFISSSFCFWDSVTSACGIPNISLKTCNSSFCAAESSIGQWYIGGTSEVHSPVAHFRGMPLVPCPCDKFALDPLSFKHSIWFTALLWPSPRANCIKTKQNFLWPEQGRGET